MAWYPRARGMAAVCGRRSRVVGLREPAAQPADLRPARRVGRRVRTDPLRRGVQARILRSLRLVRPPLDEPDRRDGEQRELQELRLPVLEHRPCEVRGDEVAAPGQGLLPVLGALGVHRPLPHERLAGDRDEKERPEEHGEAVVSQKASHQPRTPTATRNANAAAMKPR